MAKNESNYRDFSCKGNIKSCLGIGVEHVEETLAEKYRWKMLFHLSFNFNDSKYQKGCDHSELKIKTQQLMNNLIFYFN